MSLKDARPLYFNKQTLIFCAGLFVAGFFSRYFLAITNFSALDSVQYALGLLNFSIVDHTPPPPGYFLYLMTAKLLNVFLNNPQQSLVFISIIYSGLLSVLIFLFGKELFGTLAGFLSSLLFLTSPVFWYKGITIYGYLNSGFFLLLTAFFCYKVILGKHQFIYLAALSYAVCIGVRPQEFPTLLLLFLFSLYHVSFGEKFKSILLFAVICLCWFVPLVMMSHGWGAFFKVIHEQSSYLRQDSVFGGALLSQINNHFTRMGQYFERLYFLGILPLMYYGARFFQFQNFYQDKKVGVLFLLIFPQLLLNIFILYAEVGHGMAWALGFLLIMGEAIVVFSKDMAQVMARFFKKFSNPDFLRVFFERTCLACVVLGIVGINMVMFLHNFNFNIFQYDKVISDQRQFNYVDAKTVDDHLNSKIDFIKKNFNTQKTLILSKEFQRQIMYYIPEAVVLRHEGVYRKGKRALTQCSNLKCEYAGERDFFDIPSSIETLIIFDDPLMSYVSFNKKAQRVFVHDRSEILTLDIKKYDRIRFQYHAIRME